MDEYSSQLRAVFKDFDVDGDGAVGRASVKKLCQGLDLEEYSDLLIQKVFREDSKKKVTFEEFKEAFISILQDADTRHTEDEKPAVTPRCVLGGKRYGRRSKPELLGKVRRSLEKPENGQGERDLTPEGHVHGDCDFQSRNMDETFEAKGQLNQTMSEIDHKEPDNGQDQLMDVLRTLDVGRDGFLTLDELRTVCNSIDMEMSNDEIWKLFQNLDTDHDGHISLQELQNRFKKSTRICHQTPSPSHRRHRGQRSSGTPKLRPGSAQRKLRLSLTPERNMAPVMLTSGEVTGLFSALDPWYTGFAQSEDIIDLWEKYSIQNGADILNALGFNRDSRINLSELSLTLENALANQDLDALSHAALVTCQQELRHLRSSVESLTNERNKLRLDLTEAYTGAALLAQEVDERHAHIEKSNESKLLTIEKKYQDQVRGLQGTLKSEREAHSTQTDRLQDELETELKATKQQEKKMSDNLAQAEAEIERLQQECTRLAENLEEACVRNQRLQEELCALEELRAKMTDQDVDEMWQTNLKESHRLAIKEFKDQVDELTVEKEDLRQQLASQKRKLRNRSQTKIPVKEGHFHGDQSRPGRKASLASMSSTETEADEIEISKSKPKPSRIARRKTLRSSIDDSDSEHSLSSSQKVLLLETDHQQIEHGYRLEVSHLEDRHRAEKQQIMHSFQKEKDELRLEFERKQEQTLAEQQRDLLNTCVQEKQDLLQKYESMKNLLTAQHNQEKQQLLQRLKEEYDKDLEFHLSKVREDFSREKARLEEDRTFDRRTILDLEKMCTKLDVRLKTERQEAEEARELDHEKHQDSQEHMIEAHIMEKEELAQRLKAEHQARLCQERNLQTNDASSVASNQSEIIRDLEQRIADLDLKLALQREEVEAECEGQRLRLEEQHQLQLKEMEARFQLKLLDWEQLLEQGTGLQGKLKEDVYALLQEHKNECLTAEQTALYEELQPHRNSLNAEHSTQVQELHHRELELEQRKAVVLEELHQREQELHQKEVDLHQRELEFEQQKAAILEDLGQQKAAVLEELHQRDLEFEEQQRELHQSEQELHQKEQELHQRELELHQRELKFEQQKAAAVEYLECLERSLKAEREAIELDKKKYEDWGYEILEELEQQGSDIERARDQTAKRDLIEERCQTLEASLEERKMEMDAHLEDVSRREQHVDMRERDVDKRERDVDKRERDVDKREMDVERREMDVDKREKDVERREMDVDKREKDVERREMDVDKKEKDVERREMDVDKKEKDVEWMAMDVDKREKDVERMEKEVYQLVKDVERRERDVEKKIHDVDMERKDMDRREKDVDMREKDVDTRGKDVDRRERDMDRHVKDVEKLQRGVEKQLDDVNRQEKDVDGRGKHVEKQIQDVNRKEQDVSRREQDVNRREQDVNRREQDVERWEKDLERQVQNAASREQAVEVEFRRIDAELSQREHDLESERYLLERTVSDFKDIRSQHKEVLSKQESELTADIDTRLASVVDQEACIDERTSNFELYKNKEFQRLLLLEEELKSNVAKLKEQEEKFKAQKDTHLIDLDEERSALKQEQSRLLKWQRDIEEEKLLSICDLKQEVERLRDEKEGLLTESTFIGDLKQEVERLTIEKEDLMTEMASIDDLKQEVERLTIEKEGLITERASIDDLKQEVDDLKREVERLTIEKEGLITERASIDDLKQEVDDLKQKVGRLTIEKDGLITERASIDYLKQEVDDLKQEVGILTVENEGLITEKASIDDLKQEMEKLTIEKDGLITERASIDDLKQEIERLGVEKEGLITEKQEQMVHMEEQGHESWKADHEQTMKDGGIERTLLLPEIEARKADLEEKKLEERGQETKKLGEVNGERTLEDNLEAKMEGRLEELREDFAMEKEMLCESYDNEKTEILDKYRGEIWELQKCASEMRQRLEEENSHLQELQQQRETEKGEFERRIWELQDQLTSERSIMEERCHLLEKEITDLKEEISSEKERGRQLARRQKETLCHLQDQLTEASGRLNRRDKQQTSNDPTGSFKHKEEKEKAMRQEKKLLEQRLQKVSDKLLEVTTEMSVSQSRHLKEISQWKDSTRNMVDLEHFTNLQLNLLSQQRYINEVQTALQEKLNLIEGLKDSHRKQVKQLEKDKKELQMRREQSHNMFIEQTQKLTKMCEKLSEKNLYIYDIHMENCQLVDKVTVAEDRRHQAEKQCRHVEKKCASLQKLVIQACKNIEESA